eukprot:TRINITY_DN13659_c0_g1_i1.p1 TRINITY_DN13659_c0_g1~~TRINITY_DN13659_c0_g1_i1.p1  ORF type:complete len:190 (+),score=33.28 TRINITY_DN13659_c0_g1_i1:408-977(+)
MHCLASSSIVSSRLGAFWFGTPSLPILEALHDVISFLIVTLFFTLASMQVSYALTDARLSDIFFDTYRMGFVGDMTNELFFNKDGPAWTLESLFHFWWYFFFSFLVMVSLANIFIQVMGNAYDKAEKRVGISFVRSRMSVTLHYTVMADALDDLFARRCKDDATGYLWLAFPRNLDVALELEEELPHHR